jgi:hypothetical protein
MARSSRPKPLRGRGAAADASGRSDLDRTAATRNARNTRPGRITAIAAPADAIAEAVQFVVIERAFAKYAAEINAAWRERWPAHCPACSGWGGTPINQSRLTDSGANVASMRRGRHRSRNRRWSVPCLRLELRRRPACDLSRIGAGPGPTDATPPGQLLT